MRGPSVQDGYREEPAPEFASVLWSRGFRRDYDPDGNCLGVWEEKYWPNFPGPIYSTISNTMSCGAYHTDGSDGVILHDGNHEFVWRQPVNGLELSRTLYALTGDEVASFQVDGNERWTPETVRAWWDRRGELMAWLSRVIQGDTQLLVGDRHRHDHALELKSLLKFRRFLDESAELHLRRYVYYLSEQRLPSTDSDLPVL